jgi:fatty acid kinase
MTAVEFLDGVAVLRERLGGSLVVLGGGQWNVHVHVADAGAAIEAGMAAGHIGSG